MEERKQLQFIANQYGYEAQSRQLIEEMAELTQAINKLWRKAGNQYKKAGLSMDESVVYEVQSALYEEIADVEVCLEQVKYLMDCEDDVRFFRSEKIKRQILRIEGEGMS